MSDFGFDRLKKVQEELDKQVAAIQNNDAYKDEAKAIMIATLQQQVYQKLREEIAEHDKAKTAEAEAEVAAIERKLAELNKEPSGQEELLKGIWQMLRQQELSKQVVADAAAALSAEGYLTAIRGETDPRRKLAIAENAAQIVEILKGKGANDRFLTILGGHLTDWLHSARLELMPQQEKKLREQLKEAQDKLSNVRSASFAALRIIDQELDRVRRPSDFFNAQPKKSFWG